MHAKFHTQTAPLLDLHYARHDTGRFISSVKVQEFMKICVQNTFVLKDGLNMSSYTYSQFSEVISNGEIRCSIFGPK